MAGRSKPVCRPLAWTNAQWPVGEIEQGSIVNGFISHGQRLDRPLLELSRTLELSCGPPPWMAPKRRGQPTKQTTLPVSLNWHGSIRWLALSSISCSLYSLLCLPACRVGFNKKENNLLAHLRSRWRIHLQTTRLGAIHQRCQDCHRLCYN